MSKLSEAQALVTGLTNETTRNANTPLRVGTAMTRTLEAITQEVETRVPLLTAYTQGELDGVRGVAEVFCFDDGVAGVGFTESTATNFGTRQFAVHCTVEFDYYVQRSVNGAGLRVKRKLLGNQTLAWTDWSVDSDIDKIDKDGNKVLSTNDYTDAAEAEVAKIANKQEALVSETEPAFWQAVAPTTQVDSDFWYNPTTKELKYWYEDNGIWNDVTIYLDSIFIYLEARYIWTGSDMLLLSDGTNKVNKEDISALVGSDVVIGQLADTVSIGDSCGTLDLGQSSGGVTLGNFVNGTVDIGRYSTNVIIGTASEAVTIGDNAVLTNIGLLSTVNIGEISPSVNLGYFANNVNLGVGAGEVKIGSPTTPIELAGNVGIGRAPHAVWKTVIGNATTDEAKLYVGKTDITDNTTAQGYMAVFRMTPNNDSTGILFSRDGYGGVSIGTGVSNGMGIATTNQYGGDAVDMIEFGTAGATATGRWLMLGTGANYQLYPNKIVGNSADTVFHNNALNPTRVVARVAGTATQTGDLFDVGILASPTIFDKKFRIDKDGSTFINSTTEATGSTAALYVLGGVYIGEKLIVDTIQSKANSPLVIGQYAESVSIGQESSLFIGDGAYDILIGRNSVLEIGETSQIRIGYYASSLNLGEGATSIDIGGISTAITINTTSESAVTIGTTGEVFVKNASGEIKSMTKAQFNTWLAS